MADNLNKLGGGVASAVSLRGVGSVNQPSSNNNNVSALVSGINDIVQTVVKVKVAEEKQRVQEDKIRAVSNAESEHLDANNALAGGSYDNELNTQVDSWRSSGLLESEIRTNIKNYKFNKAVKDTKLGVPDGREADDVDIAFFDTFNKLELQALTPILQQDRKEMQVKINNMNSSYFRTGSDDLQTKLNNVTIANKSYGMGEEEAMSLAIQSAFDLAKQGDNSLLTQLQDVKTSTGEKVVDTLTGSALYTKLQDNLMARKEHETAKARQEQEFQQEVTATKLYTNMIDTGDLHSFKLNIDNALESGSISMRQHSSLQGYYKTATDVSSFPKNSDMKVYMSLFAKAEQGTLSSDELIKYQSKLSSNDFESIAKRSIQQGGLEGLGNEASKNLSVRVDDDAKAYSGLNFIDDLTSKLEDRQLADKRFSYIKQTLATEKDKFIAINKRLPDNTEYESIRDKVVSQAEKHITIKPLEVKPTLVEPKANKVNGVDELKSQLRSLKTIQEKELWYSSLTPKEKELLRNSR